MACVYAELCVAWCRNDTPAVVPPPAVMPLTVNHGGWKWLEVMVPLC
jgi:hypothetical protein